MFSVVIPVYRSQQSLPLIVAGVADAALELNESWEIIFVDDASPPQTWQTLTELHKQWPKNVTILRLARNSGQHNAVLCGFGYVTGDVVVTMDDDLQNPPEEIPKLVRKVREGFDVAIGAYQRKRSRRGLQLGGALVDATLRHIFKLPKDFQLTSFRAIRGSVVAASREMGGTFPYVTAILLANSSNQANVVVRHEPRKYGKSNYNLKNSIQLAANLLFSYSALPVYIVALMCGISFLLSLALAVWAVASSLVYGRGIPGWASLMATTSFLNAIVLFSLVIFGVYLSRVSVQLSQSRHRFVVAEQYLSKTERPPQ